MAWPFRAMADCRDGLKRRLELSRDGLQMWSCHYPLHCAIFSKCPLSALT
jgi:hypothetical protein